MEIFVLFGRILSNVPNYPFWHFSNLYNISTLFFSWISGNIFDDVKALSWILDQADNDSIEELTSPMIEKMIREAKNFVVLFCKYAGYMLIAITHTCYMLRHYTGSTTATSVVQNNNLQNGQVLNNFVEQKPDTYLPAERVRGLAMESWIIPNSYLPTQSATVQ